MENEIWKSIDNCIPYEISNFGTVRNYESGEVMKQTVNRDGYLQVSVRPNRGKSYGRRIHRLLMLSFKEKVEGKDVVNHIDGNKLNNDLNNLEWVTAIENSTHAAKIGLYRAGDNHASTSFKDRDIISILILIKTRKLCYREIGEKFGQTAKSVIYDVLTKGYRGSITKKFFSDEELKILRNIILLNGKEKAHKSEDKIKFTQEEIEKIVLDYTKNHLSCRQIGNEFNVGGWIIRKLLVKHKINTEIGKKGKVAQLNRKTGEIIKIWDSQKEINKAFKCVPTDSSLSSVLRGRRKSCFGYAWKYSEELPISE